MKTLITLENKPKIINFINNLQPDYFEIEISKKKRTNKQNRALHKFFILIATELNNLGITFQYKGIKGFEFEIPYTAEIVKNFIWRPIQIALYKFESTTKLTTDKINTIYDIINKYFCEKGIYIEFPNN